MKRSSDILLPRALLSIQHMSLRPVLAMVYCEGSVEYRDTTTMNVIPRDGKDHISSLAQVGLYFPGNRFCKSHVQPTPTSDASCSNHERHLSCIIGLHTALSPNACAAVSLDEQHLASLCSLQFEDENTSDQLDESVYSPQPHLAPTNVHSATRSHSRSLCNAVIGCFSQQFEQRGHCRGTSSFFEPIFACPGAGRGSSDTIQFRHIQVALLERAISYDWCSRRLLYGAAAATTAAVKSRFNSSAMSECPSGPWVCWRD